jgi:uncharacterized protein YlxP (DUF503 family)
MHAAALRIELRIPAVRSLKGKRRVLKALQHRMTATFPVALAEVGFQDLWQRATLGAALVAPQAAQLERMIAALQRALHEEPDVELLEIGVAYLEEEP